MRVVNSLKSYTGETRAGLDLGVLSHDSDLSNTIFNIKETTNAKTENQKRAASVQTSERESRLRGFWSSLQRHDKRRTRCSISGAHWHFCAQHFFESIYKNKMKSKRVKSAFKCKYRGISDFRISPTRIIVFLAFKSLLGLHRFRNINSWFTKQV